MKYLSIAVCLIQAVLLCSCSSLKTCPADKANKDPFAYCAATGNIDIPSAPYAGPAMPKEIIEGLRAALKAENIPEPILAHGSFWRCMGGKVYACYTGANLPCMAKADATRTPDLATLRFCTENPQAEIVPASVTGRFTIYQWRCRNGLPEAVKQALTPDANGFIAEYWHEIKQTK